MGEEVFPRFCSFFSLLGESLFTIVSALGYVTGCSISLANISVGITTSGSVVPV